MATDLGQRRKSVDYATLITHGQAASFLPPSLLSTGAPAGDPHKVYHNFSKLGDGGYATGEPAAALCARLTALQCGARLIRTSSRLR